MAAIAKSVYSGETKESDAKSATEEYKVKLRVVVLDIQCKWSGDTKEAALRAAMEFGKLVASQIVDFEEASEEFRKLFVSKKLDEGYWKDVNETFEKSSSLPLTKNYSIQECFKVAANDNDEPQSKALPPPAPAIHPASDTPDSAGGLLCEMSEWITSTAVIPVSELSLTSSIALLCGMFGDKALTPLGGGINMYMVTVMDVGSGKGHAPKSIIKLAKAAAKPGAVTNGDPTSYAAIERMLRKNKSTVVVMDEYGETLQDVNSRQKNSAAASIRKFLLAIYDQADGTFDGRQYASADSKKDDSPIEGPALTVLGMTTASTLYNGLSEDSLGGGFISRFVFIEGKHSETIKVPSITRTKNVPSALVDRLREAITKFPKPEGEGNLTALKKYIVPFADGEEGEAYKRYSEVFLWQQWKGWDQRQHNINARVAENTLRLATVRAISRDPIQPVVCTEDVEWGWAIVHHSLEVITSGIDRHMSGSIPEALRKAVKEALRNAKNQTLPWSFLLQREGISQAVKKDVVEAISWLIETDGVESLSGGKIPGPGQKFRLKEPAQ
jgi:hypothetical protein